MKPNRRPALDAAAPPVPLSLVPDADAEYGPPAPPTPDTMDEVAIALLPGGVTMRSRHDGWTVKRQRAFLTVLAETGSISIACRYAGVSTRSAYRLRARADAGAFAQGWEDALKLATTRLLTLAYERATRGAVRETWKHGECIRTTRAPSDTMLMFLLQRLIPTGRAGDRWDELEAATQAARVRLPDAPRDVTDNAVPMVPLAVTDFYPTSPGYLEEET